MLLGLPLHELVWLTLALLAAGLLTGFIAGLLGVGGGAVVVPILYELFTLLGVSEGMRMHVCVATSLAIIIPTSFRSFYAHYKRDAVDMRVIRVLWFWVFSGVLLGILLASHAPDNFLKAAFAGSSIFMALRLIFRDGSKIKTAALAPAPWNSVAGFGIGLMSTMIGIGGGSYITAYMTFLGWPIHKAVATASGFGPIIAIPATVGYIYAGWHLQGLPPFSLGYVSAIGAAIVMPVSIFSAPWGVAVAHKMPRRRLEIIFALFLIAVASRFVANLLGPVVS